MKIREKKNQAKKLELENRRIKEKERLERVLSALGLLKGFQGMPGFAREKALKSMPGWPSVVVPPAARGSAAALGLRDQIENVLATSTIVTKNRQAIPLPDFLSICCRLPAFFRCMATAPMSKRNQLFSTHAATVSSEFFDERGKVALASLGAHVTLLSMANSRMDGEVLGCVLEDWGGLPHKPVFKLVLQRAQPRLTRVEIDGNSRRVYQCAIPILFEGIKWVECDGAPFGLDDGRMYPVWLQSHAIKRLRERLSSSAVTEFTLHMGLACSIIEMTIVERQEDKYLLAFHLCGTRIGYLVARVVGSVIVIVTFLFLTMKGTPESRILKSKLGLTDRDVEYQRLDRLETYLTPDVLADHDLVRVLESSGCDSLLKLARKGFPNNAVGGHAEELKKFLGITKGRTDQP